MLTFFWKKEGECWIFCGCLFILPNRICNHSSQVIHEILLLHRSNSSRKKETVAWIFWNGDHAFIGLDYICVRSYKRITFKNRDWKRYWTAPSDKFTIFTLPAYNFCRRPVFQRVYAKVSVLTAYRERTLHTLLQGWSTRVPFCISGAHSPHQVWQLL